MIQKKDLKVCKKEIIINQETISQNGEDIFIREILNTIGIKKGIIVDVGSWDGWHLSNVALLLRDGFGGVLIEGDKSKINKSKERWKDRNDIYHFEQFVDLEENSLNLILDSVSIPHNFEVLNIDIDSFDFWIWKSIKYKPKIVCIEYNGHRVDYDVTIPYNLNWQYNSNSDNYGASPKSLFRLGKHKGYDLVSISKHNLIFCDVEYSHMFETFSKISPSWIKNTFDVRPWGHRKKMPDNHFVFNPEVK